MQLLAAAKLVRPDRLLLYDENSRPTASTQNMQRYLTILELLASEGPMYGLQIVEQSGGALKRGTVYVTLGRMEAKGLVAKIEPHSGGSGAALWVISRSTLYILKRMPSR